MPGRDLDLTEPRIALGRGGQGLVALLVGSLNPPGHLYRERLGVDEHEPVAAQVQRANGGIVALLGTRLPRRRRPEGREALHDRTRRLSEGKPDRRERRRTCTTVEEDEATIVHAAALAV